MERLPTAQVSRACALAERGHEPGASVQCGRDGRAARPRVGFDVDDFDALYAKAKEMGILDSSAFGAPFRRHPAGWVQLYLRDPAGNLLEVDWPDASTLSPDTLADAQLELGAQAGDAAVATLYHS